MSLTLASTIPPLPLPLPNTLSSAPNSTGPRIVAAVGSDVCILTPQGTLLYSIPIHKAFPSLKSASSNGHSTSRLQVDAVAFDTRTGRIAASVLGRVALFEPRQRHDEWTVHSTFVPCPEERIAALDFAPCKNSRIAIGTRKRVSVWELSEQFGIGVPKWIKIALTIPDDSKDIDVAKLSPSGTTLAVLYTSSNVVRLSSIRSTSNPDNALQFMSNAWHSLPIKSIQWRESDDVADSGPVLFTVTVDNHLHVWGCMIDEPTYFSLWASLDMCSISITGGSSLYNSVRGVNAPGRWPVFSGYLRTRTSDYDDDGIELQNVGHDKGKIDEFLSILDDGTCWITEVTNFDSRPPMCLSQSSYQILGEKILKKNHIPHLRHATIFPSKIHFSVSTDQYRTLNRLEAPPPEDFTLVGRSTHGELVSIQLRIPILQFRNLSPVISPRNSLNKAARKQVEPDRPSLNQPAKIISANMIGRITWLAQGLQGECLLARGTGDGRVSTIKIGKGERESLKGTWIQTWTADHGVATNSFVQDGFEDALKMRVWNNGRSVATLSSCRVRVWELGRNGALEVVAEHVFSMPLDIPSEEIKTSFEAFDETLVQQQQSTTFFLAPSPDSSAVNIVFVLCGKTVYVWVFDCKTKSIVVQPTWDVPALNSLTSMSEESIIQGSSNASILCASPIPPVDSETIETSFVTANSRGTIKIYSNNIDSADYVWKESTSIGTGIKNIRRVACSSKRMSGIVSSRDDGKYELSIWDSKESAFSSGQHYLEVFNTPIVDLHWSLHGSVLAVATQSEVKLLCAQRLDDISGAPTWGRLASIRVSHLTSAPISAVTWLDHGVAIASGSTIFIYSPKMRDGISLHKHANRMMDPLPIVHPQFLFQLLLHGRLDSAMEILNAVASQLDENGEVYRLERPGGKVEIEDILTHHKNPVKIMFTVSDPHFASRSHLSEASCSRLRKALQRNLFRELSNMEHRHLDVVVQTVYEVQRQQSAIDTNGIRYLISMRSFFLFSEAQVPSPIGPSAAVPRIRYRDATWAFYSENQTQLVEASVKACPHKLLWANAKALSLFMWIKSSENLNTQAEAIARAEFMKPNTDDKDPEMASLWYLALRKKHMLVTVWKQSNGHPDQRNILKLLANDFSLPRWKTAALKNAFALMSKRRFLFAAVFFLLGDSLQDAANVCVRQLQDFQLAIAIARIYEGDDGPVLESILENSVLPFAFQEGYRWLASWAFWMLKKRDYAVQAIITPLAEFAEILPYKLPIVGRPMNEDPCLVFLYAHLRSWSLQTMKGASSISGRTEFDFVLYISRVLRRMGCHILALNLLSSWEFQAPSTTMVKNPANSFHNKTLVHSLRRKSTKIDIDIPSNLTSRAPSPTLSPTKSSFKQFLKQTKKETQAPPEFSFDAFRF